MGDRELLELAAKAIGFTDYYVSEWVGGVSLMHSPDQKVGPVEWDPLADDGDALRLMVKLGIQIIGSRKSRSVGRVIQAWFPEDGNPNRSASEKLTTHVNGDKLSATRRAIVLAAAQVGMGKP